MALKTNDFDYALPQGQIAQHPAQPRESARLMIVDRRDGKLVHKHVADFPECLQKDDVLVVNNTKVFHARLKINTKELFLIRPHGALWQAIGRNIQQGETLLFTNTVSAKIREKHPDGTLLVAFSTPDVIGFANKFGEVPVPPYIKSLPRDGEYQTVYAKITGSVAAPTAGFHLTKNLLKKINEKGVTVLEITLHVGLGTFMPIKTDSVAAHTMHSEWVSIAPEVSRAILSAKKQGRRIVAVGTTTVRALEGTRAQPYQGDVKLFIQPGYQFKIVDAMLTNFHLPKSTLIVLVSAFASREIILRAYHEAVTNGYRFYSFGDAMFIV